MTDFTDRARAEAERRWSGPNIVMPSGWHEKGMASGFVLGALWAAKQEPSDAEEWQVAEALHRQNGSPCGDTDLLPERYLRAARAAIAAFLAARRGPTDEHRG